MSIDPWLLGIMEEYKQLHAGVILSAWAPIVQGNLETGNPLHDEHCEERDTTLWALSLIILLCLMTPYR